MINIQKHTHRSKNILSSAALIAILSALVFTMCINSNTPVIDVPKSISIFDIKGVSRPVIGETPVTMIEETDQYTGTVSWSPYHSSFEVNVEYIAIINLFAKKGYNFSHIPENFFRVQGAVASNNVNAGSVVAVFPKIDEFTIVFPPHPRIDPVYSPGMTLASVDLDENYLWVNPDFFLNAGVHSFEAIYTNPNNSRETARGYITVNVLKAVINFEEHPPISVSYISGMTLASLNSRLKDNYSWYDPATVIGPGSAQSFAAIYTVPGGNYEIASGYITVNVDSTNDNFINHPSISAIYEAGKTLASLDLNENYAWNDPSEELNAGVHSFEAVYTDPNGVNEPALGLITVIVSKAAGIFIEHSPINGEYKVGMILASLNQELLPNYYWHMPLTDITPDDNGRSFAAIYNDPEGNYEPAGGFIIVNVAKAKGADVGKAIKISVTSNSISIQAYPDTSQSVEYFISENSGLLFEGTETWQTGLTFTGLSANTTYYIYARSVESNFYRSGEPSVSDPITTNPLGTGTIAFLWLDDIGKLAVSGVNSPVVAPGDPLIISAVNTNFDNYEWHLNGNVVLSGETEYEYEFSSQVSGKYVIGLFIEKDGNFFNTNITITVTED